MFYFTDLLFLLCVILMVLGSSVCDVELTWLQLPRNASKCLQNSTCIFKAIKVLPVTVVAREQGCEQEYKGISQSKGQVCQLQVLELSEAEAIPKFIN